jgi:predicted deacetylase
MKGARYLVRFDDICPTMDWSVWDAVESLLFELDIKPILAVVPDNQDTKLVVAPPRQDFWDRVRYWQSQGWSIALHGFEHRYETTSSGLIGLNRYSEFAGLARDVQRQKLESALKIFSAHSISADAWVAPAHSFDQTTVEVLSELGVRVISDGYYWKPVQRMGAVWVPQQMWRLRPLPGGVWTVCYHPNRFSVDDVTRLSADLRRFRGRIVGLSSLLSEEPIAPESYWDRLFNWCWMQAIHFKRRWRG